MCFLCFLFLSRCLSFNPVRSYFWRFLRPHTIQGLASARNLTLIQLEVLPQMPCKFVIFTETQKHQAPHVAGLVVMENQGLQFKACRMWERWMSDSTTVPTELCWGTRLDDVQDLCCRDNSWDRTSLFHQIHSYSIILNNSDALFTPCSNIPSPLL